MYVARHMKKFIKTGQRGLPRRQPVIEFQNKIVEMYVAREGVEEGVERGRGGRFIRWTFDRKLGENHAPSIIAKFGQHINTTYIRYSYVYVIVNIETGLKMVYYKLQRGS